MGTTTFSGPVVSQNGFSSTGNNTVTGNISATGGIAGWGVTPSTAQIAALTTVGAATLSTAQTSNLTTTQLSRLCTNNDLIIQALQKLGVAP